MMGGYLANENYVGKFGELNAFQQIGTRTRPDSRRDPNLKFNSIWYKTHF